MRYRPRSPTQTRLRLALPSVTADQVRAAYEANRDVSRRWTWEEVKSFPPLYRSLEIEAALTGGKKK